MVIIIFIAFIVTCITVDAVIQYSRRKRAKTPDKSEVSSRVFNEASLSAPLGLYFDKTHTWAYIEKNGLVKIGIDDFILHITGALNRVKMKNPGEIIQKGEPVLSIIRNGKQLTINSPVSGTIKSQNHRLTEDCSLINSSPFYEGWVYMIEPSNWLRETQFMFMGDKYKEWLKNEFSRLKDFLASIRLIDNKELLPIMLQDGGELKDDLLADCEPELWEEFQIKFINTYR